MNTPLKKEAVTMDNIKCSNYSPVFVDSIKNEVKKQCEALAAYLKTVRNLSYEKEESIKNTIINSSEKIGKYAGASLGGALGVDAGEYIGKKTGETIAPHIIKAIKCIYNVVVNFLIKLLTFKAQDCHEMNSFTHRNDYVPQFSTSALAA